MGYQAEMIRGGRTSLGIELGSTRIKAVLIGEDYLPLATGSHNWVNRYEDHIWTYDIADIWSGLQDSYRKLVEQVEETYGVALERIGSIGISAMMHGYMVFDRNGDLLAPFRTWRNTNTKEASEKLTELFQFHIPQRWSIAHLYQAILNREEHVSQIDFMTTLAGYVHWKLTGRKVLGIGDASGMLPVDSVTGDYYASMLRLFQQSIGSESFAWKLDEILPEVLTAGEEAGWLTKDGAALLDPSGALKEGILFCPPEGDAGTGMVATNSVRRRTGNVSAGTSVFAMIVLEQELSGLYREIDLVTTPSGEPVAMVHSNNCTSDLNAWVRLFQEFSKAAGAELPIDEIYSVLYRSALDGDVDCGGLMAYCYDSGEHITGFEKGCPLYVRTPESRLNLPNFMKTHLFTSLGALKIGMDILVKQEGVRLDRILGHGGLFKTKGVGQQIMAAALGVPVAVMNTASEGGAWGIALLASYLIHRDDAGNLAEFLEKQVFAAEQMMTMDPDPREIESFEKFMERYRTCLPIERAAVDFMF